MANTYDFITPELLALAETTESLFDLEEELETLGFTETFRKACNLCDFASMRPGIVPNFESTRAAYDACNSEDLMTTGRPFTVKSEGCVGVAWAWPIAVTEAYGGLHRTERHPAQWTAKDDYDRRVNERLTAGAMEAIAIAKRLGFKLAPWAA